MNYLKGIIFIIVFIISSITIGSCLTKHLKIENNKFSSNFVFGYFIIFFIGFIVGLPLHLLDVSWKIYKLIFSLFLLAGIVILIFYKKENIVDIHFSLIDHLKNYWIIYIFSFLFLVFSISNMQPYLMNNYSDDSYIVRILHLINSEHLFDVSYQGVLSSSTGSLSIAREQGLFFRFLNTYELTYAYFSDLFRISTPFFCRFCMTFLNYFLIFNIFCLFGSLFVSSNYSQYACLFTIFFILPQGFAAKSNLLPFKIRFYENWRFQTAMYMGGSIVRVAFFPLTFYIITIITNMKISAYKFKDLIDKILLFAMILFTFISFHTMAISYIVIFMIFLILYKILNIELNYINNTKCLPVIVITIICFVCFIKILDKLTISKIVINLMQEIKVVSMQFDFNNLIHSTKEYLKYYDNTFKYDFVAIYGLIPLSITLLFCFILYFKNNNKYFYDSLRVIIITLIFYLLIRLHICDYLLSMIGFTFYGTARILSSLIILLTLYVGISFILLINLGEKYFTNFLNDKIPFIFSLCIILLISNLLINRQNELKKYTNVEDGITKYGYSCAPLVSNDSLIPQPFNELGRYFDGMNGRYFSLAIESKIKINGYTYESAPLNALMSSGKIIMLDAHKINKKYVNLSLYTNWQYLYDKFCQGKIDYNVFYDGIKNCNIQYLFTNRKNIKDIYSMHGFKCVYTNKKYKYWVFHTNI